MIGKAQWSKFNLDVAQRIIDLVRAGSTRANAAARVKVSDRTLKLWVQKGRRNLEAQEAAAAEVDEYGLFVEELLQAEATVSSAAEGVLFKAMKEGGQLGLRAAMFFLKHRGGPEYRTRVEQVGRDGESIHEGARDRLRERLAEKRAAAAARTQTH